MSVIFNTPQADLLPTTSAIFRFETPPFLIPSFSRIHAPAARIQSP